MMASNIALFSSIISLFSSNSFVLLFCMFDNLRQTQNRTLKGVHLVHEIVLCIVQAKVFLLHALKTDIIGGHDV